MLSKTLGSSRKFAATGKRAGEFPQLLFSLLVPHTDDFGRMPGDAFTVKMRVFPTSPRSEDEFDAALTALEGTNLIVRYDDGHGGSVLQIIKFDEHQKGLHKRTRSEFPPPPPHLPGISRKVADVPPEPNRREPNPPKSPARGGRARRRVKPMAVASDAAIDEQLRIAKRRDELVASGMTREDASAQIERESAAVSA